MHSARREIIRDLLQSHPFLSLHDLEARFPDVSSMTLRRDIEYFEREGEAIKVRGGARSMKFITTSMEESFNLRLHANSGAKEAIAEKAAEMIEPGRSIFLDSGTTVLKLAALIGDERLTITTSGPNVALELLKKNMPIVNIVGGMINRDNISVSGTQAMQYMEDINIDIAFLTPSGLTYENGFTAGFWQMVAILFSQNLKTRYDPAGKDSEIEELVKIWESGRWNTLYYSIFMEMPPKTVIKSERLHSIVRH